MPPRRTARAPKVAPSHLSPGPRFQVRVLGGSLPLSRNHWPSEARLGGARVQRLTLGYFGVDPLDPMEAGHAHAVMAVVHKVVPTQLLQAHRRQLLPEAKSPVDPLPLLRISPGQGHEVLVEVLVLAQAADNPRCLDCSPTSIHGSAGRNPPSEFPSGEKGAPGAPPEQERLQPAEPRPPLGEGEVQVDLVL